MQNNIEAIIFDLDGTMWNALDGIHKTWNQVVSNHPEYRTEPISYEELEGCLGLPMTDIAAKLFPGTEMAQQQALMDECCAVENAYLAEHGGILYPKLEETLLKLKKTYRLFVVSNCQDGYIQAFFAGTGLGKYFTGFECAGRTGRPKADNIALVARQYALKNPVYVGDTALDYKSATEAGVPFVHASYGFGTVEGVPAIHALEELPGLLEKLEAPLR